MRACGGGRTGGGASAGDRREQHSFGVGSRDGVWDRRVSGRIGESGLAKREKTCEKRVATWIYADRRAGVARGATRRAIVAGRVPEHAPIESSSPQGPVISPTPSRGPRRARHSASAGLSGVTVRLPSPWRSEDATPLDELPPPAPPAPPPPPPAPRGPELPPLDIVFRRFTRRKPPPPPRGYACPVSDCHHGKILSFGAKRGAGKTKARTTRERGDYKRARRLGAHTKSRKLPLFRAGFFSARVPSQARDALHSRRRAALDSASASVRSPWCSATPWPAPRLPSAAPRRRSSLPRA